MKAVHFGAGNIGRGFIGELLYESGFSTTFVDVVKATVDYINETNSYEMYIIDNNEKKGCIFHKCYVDNIIILLGSVWLY